MSTLRAVALCLVLLLLAPMRSPAQAPSARDADAGLMQTLIAEVRALRLAIEKSSAVGPRMQLAVARYQMQQDRVQRKERELEALRNQISGESVGRDRMQIALRQFEEQARQATDPAMRKQLEDSAGSVRTEIEQQVQREQQARAQESVVLGDLRLEQAKLTELSTQMDQLDKLLSQP